MESDPAFQAQLSERRRRNREASRGDVPGHVLMARAIGTLFPDRTQRLLRWIRGSEHGDHGSGSCGG
jgi:hypothetical protein